MRVLNQTNNDDAREMAALILKKRRVGVDPVDLWALYKNQSARVQPVQGEPVPVERLRKKGE